MDPTLSKIDRTRFLQWFFTLTLQYIIITHLTFHSNANGKLVASWIRRRRIHHSCGHGWKSASGSNHHAYYDRPSYTSENKLWQCWFDQRKDDVLKANLVHGFHSGYVGHMRWASGFLIFLLICTIWFLVHYHIWKAPCCFPVLLLRRWAIDSFYIL